MGIVSKISQVVGRDSEPDDRNPTHVCQTCGREYHARRDDMEITSCVECGGADVVPA